ncbi:MAG: hypothetical protein R3B68_02455 [Phycisphaerales bacterium]
MLANGERIDVKHRDSVGLSSIEVRGRRFFSSSVQVLEVLDNELVERVISMAMIAQVVDRYPADGGNGKH